MSQAAWAQELARSLLAEPLPRRWRHTQGVAGQAERLADIAGPDADLLGAAAWLHDVGYSPDLVDSGQHALDGARYLRSRQVDDRICRLVAHHSCALIEARERGLEAELSATKTAYDALIKNGVPRIHLIEVDHMTGQTRAELDVVRTIVEEIESGQLTWSPNSLTSGKAHHG